MQLVGGIDSISPKELPLFSFTVLNTCDTHILPDIIFTTGSVIAIH